MKNIDFTRPGGFPLTQDQLGYMQMAWSEVLTALGQIGRNGAVATIIEGCAVSNVLVSGTTYAYTIAAGWVFFNGQLVRVPGNVVNIDTSANSPYISLVATSGPLTYNSGAVYNVINDVTGVLVSAATGTADTGVLFAQSELNTLYTIDPVLYADVAALTAEIAGLLGAWTATAPVVTAIGGGSVTAGTVAYSHFIWNGKTFRWHISVTGVVVTGVVTAINLPVPAIFSGSGAEWANTNPVYIPATVNRGGAPTLAFVKIFNSGGFPQAQLMLGYNGTVAFNVTTYNIDVQVVCETT